MSVSASYELYVDWANDGDFAASDMATSNLMHAHIERGFNGPMARLPQVGTATFLLRNDSREYSPPAVANALPMRDVLFTMIVGAATCDFFRGYLSEIMPTTGCLRERRVELECVDALAVLDLHEGPVPLVTDCTSSCLVNLVASAAYSPLYEDYDDGVNRFAFSADRWAFNTPAPAAGVGAGMGGYAHGAAQSYAEETRASQKIEMACAADWGRFFVSKRGAATFRNRYSSPLDSVSFYYDDKRPLGPTANTVLTTGMDYRLGVTDVYNYVEVTCHPRTVGDTEEVLGRISQRVAPVIEANSSASFVLRFRDPSNTAVRLGGKDFLDPVAGTDYVVTDDPSGEGADETGNITTASTVYADHVEIELANGAAYPVYVQALQVRGIAVRVREPVTMIASDATSIGKYQRRKLKLNATLLSNEHDAQRLATYLVGRYAEPLDTIDGLKFLANENSTQLQIARDMELEDVVDVDESVTGLSAWRGTVLSIKHDISMGRKRHEVEVALEERHTYAGTPFRHDTSQLGTPSDHVLIY